MASLTGRTVRASYIELLKLNTASTNTGVTGSLIDVTDGGNTASALSLSTSQIASSVDGSAGTAAFTRKGDTNTGVFFPAADTIAVTTNGTEHMRVTSTGLVGIGTATPLRRLHVEDSANSIVGRFLSGQTSSWIQFAAGGTGTAGRIGCPTSDAVASVAIMTSDTERLRIDSSGNVGIGTTTATSNITASNKVLDITGSSNPSLVIHGGTQEIAILSNNSTGAYFDVAGSATAANNFLQFRTSNTNSSYSVVERMRITSAGNVGIGMTPTAQLELSTDSAKKPSTNTWTIASDQRLKTNITNADNDRCYEIVKQVPLKRYTWRSEVYSEGQVKDRSKLGWIAQDVEAVFPKAVGTNRFVYNQVFEDVVTPELDSDGNTVLDENGVAKTKTEKRLVSEDVIEDCKDLNSDQIYAAMYGTIQKLIEKVETLEAKVVALQVA